MKDFGDKDIMSIFPIETVLFNELYAFPALPNRFYIIIIIIIIIIHVFRNSNRLKGDGMDIYAIYNLHEIYTPSNKSLMTTYLGSNL